MKKKTFPEELQQIVNLSENLNIPFVRLNNYEIPKEAITLLTEGLMSVKAAIKHKVIPVAKFGPVVTLAMADPLDVLVLDEVRALLKMELIPVIGMPSEITEALEIYSALDLKVDEAKAEAKDIVLKPKPEQKKDEEEVDVYKLTEISSQESIIKTVNDFILGAINSLASDIHIEPYENEVRLRYRIDGALRQISVLANDIKDALFARIKIMSRLDITQRHIPQDGRFSINLQDREIDFRVSVLPTQYGEKVVIRILDKEAMKLDLSSLGFSECAFQLYDAAIASPFGLVLVTGPTGSGKSTTLYSMLSKLNTPDKNIVTIEDPIEYYLRGVTQIQIKPEIGLSFAQCLRAVLRQSPDIIMLGEIRDIETADIAMKAALTGHLVLATLHTNDALSSISRLLDMGVESFLIAGSIRMVSAQRLCRRLCPSCKEKYVITKEGLMNFGIEISHGHLDLWRPKGCVSCANTGYKGRVGIVEAFLIDDKFKDIIIRRGSLSEIKEYAHVMGMRTLREDGLQKAVLGETSLEEVLRVTAES
jgi:type IV pilus assembly protein PilB